MKIKNIMLTCVFFLFALALPQLGLSSTENEDFEGWDGNPFSEFSQQEVTPSCQRKCRKFYYACIEQCADPGCDQGCRETYRSCLKDCEATVQ